MSIYSIEESSFKTWMIANMKIWGFIPVVATWFIATLIVGILNPDADTQFMVWGLFAAIGSGFIFGLAQENPSTLLIYTLILGLPLVLLLWHFEAINLTTGMKVYLWICLGLSVFIGSIVGVYAYQNADQVISRLFVFTSSAKARFEAEMSIAYMRFVEAYLFTFIGFGVFAPLFS